MAEPSIYRYLDHRAFLRDWFAARKRDDPSFSRREFARRAGRTSPGFLTEVMDGARQLTPPTVAAIAHALGLSRAESTFFADLVTLAQTEVTPERNEVWDRISSVPAFRAARKLEGASFTYLSSWWFPVVRELATRSDFREDPAWIAKRVRPQITESQARKALDTLFELGLLVRRGDRVEQADAVVGTPHEVQTLAVHNYHRGMLERASEAIDRFPAEERHLLASTVSVPSSLVPRLKEELNRFQERLTELCTAFEGPADQVLQLHLVMFPLSDRAGEES